MIKYTNHFLSKIEDMISASDYMLRYEKGNFKAGYCLLKDQKIMIVNKFFTTEGKINCLLDMLREAVLDKTSFAPKQADFYAKLDEIIKKEEV